MTSQRAPRDGLDAWVVVLRARLWRAPWDDAQAGLFDFGFAKFDVLLGDRIVFLLDQFVGHRARILARHIVKAGVRAGHELDFDRRILGHVILRYCRVWRNLVSKLPLSRKRRAGKTQT